LYVPIRGGGNPGKSKPERSSKNASISKTKGSNEKKRVDT
jgi:hypothetical protein